MTSPTPTSPSTPPSGDSLSLLAAARQQVALLQQLLEQQQRDSQQLEELRYLLHGFSSGGASFSGYQVDPFTAAYLAVLGPLLATRLASQESDLAELMKGATLLAKSLIEELAAYRSTRSGLDYLEEQTATLHDPWSDGQQSP